MKPSVNNQLNLLVGRMTHKLVNRHLFISIARRTLATHSLQTTRRWSLNTCSLCIKTVQSIGALHACDRKLISFFSFVAYNLHINARVFGGEESNSAENSETSSFHCVCYPHSGWWLLSLFLPRSLSHAHTRSHLPLPTKRPLVFPGPLFGQQFKVKLCLSCSVNTAKLCFGDGLNSTPGVRKTTHEWHLFVCAFVLKQTDL